MAQIFSPGSHAEDEAGYETYTFVEAASPERPHPGVAEGELGDADGEGAIQVEIYATAAGDGEAAGFGVLCVLIVRGRESLALGRELVEKLLLIGKEALLGELAAADQHLPMGAPGAGAGGNPAGAGHVGEGIAAEGGAEVHELAAADVDDELPGGRQAERRGGAAAEAKSRLACSPEALRLERDVQLEGRRAGR